MTTETFDATRVAERLTRRVQKAPPVKVLGRITRLQGPLLRATMEEVRIGEECHLRHPDGSIRLTAEVVGFDGGEVLLAPGGDAMGLSSRTEVLPTGRLPQAAVGEALRGRVIDAFGRPLDGGEAIPATGALHRDAPNPMHRPPIDRALETGVRAIDGLLTLGDGQRVGLFGAAGVGKSRLLAQIIRNAQADRIVLGLIGERGREVAEFLDRDLGEEGRARAAVIVATSDRPANERLRAAYAATAAAEAFRDAGHSTLLLIDSATRVARALREIGLAAGEPPVRRGFPPSTFAALPRLVERAGRTGSGSITAIYTVLVEGDDDDADPVADELRSLLDGHIVLSRSLAGRGHFPAIDILKSTSRLADAVTPEDHQAAARTARLHLAKLDEIELLVQIGEYADGSDTAADAALVAKDRLQEYLRQPAHERSEMAETLAQLQGLSA